MSKAMNDAEFAEQALNRLAPAPVPQALEDRIMADYATMMNQPGLRERIRAALAAAFPGLRPWQPALAFAMALIIGGVGGTLLPATSVRQTTTSTQVVQTASAADNETYTDTGLGTALSMAGEM